MQLKIGYLFQCLPRASPWVMLAKSKVALKGQKLSISKLLPFQGVLDVTYDTPSYSLAIDYPDADILGHRDLPDVRKECPYLDVKQWLKEINFHL